MNQTRDYRPLRAVWAFRSKTSSYASKRVAKTVSLSQRSLSHYETRNPPVMSVFPAGRPLVAPGLTTLQGSSGHLLAPSGSSALTVPKIRLSSGAAKRGIARFIVTGWGRACLALAGLDWGPFVVIASGVRTAVGVKFVFVVP